MLRFVFTGLVAKRADWEEDELHWDIWPCGYGEAVAGVAKDENQSEENRWYKGQQRAKNTVCHWPCIPNA